MSVSSVSVQQMQGVSLADQWSHLLDSLGGGSATARAPRLSTSSFGGGGGGSGYVQSNSPAHAAGIVASGGGGAVVAAAPAGGGLKAIFSGKSRTFVIAVAAGGFIFLGVLVYAVFLMFRRWKKKREQHALEKSREVFANAAAAGLGTISLPDLAEVPVSDPFTPPQQQQPSTPLSQKTTSTSLLPTTLPPHAGEPVRAAPRRDMLVQSPTRGIEGDAPRNVGGESGLREMHRRYLDDGGKDDSETPSLPPPDFATGAVGGGDGDGDKPGARPTPPPAALSALAADAATVHAMPTPPTAKTAPAEAVTTASSSVSEQTVAAAPPLSSDPNFVPLTD
jgi:hypothetical protein